MIRPCMAALVLAATAAAADPVRVGSPYVLHRDIRPGDTYMGVEFRGALKLAAARIDDLVLGGLSALAYDADERVLYALSDGGTVFSMRPEHDAQGFLADVEVLRAFALKDANGAPLRGRHADSEALALRGADNGITGDTQLLVAFERVPRVLRFTADGALLGAIALPAKLRDVGNYKTANRGLESLAWHPRHGPLTAPEQPLRGAPDASVELHALASGRHWRYPLAAEPNAGLADVVVLGDGSLLTLERGFGLFFVPFVSSLRRVRELPAADGATLAVETVARLNTGQGWSLDNFEGLALLGPDRVVMVSDDNRRALQSTLLAEFRLLDAAPRAAPGRAGAARHAGESGAAD